MDQGHISYDLRGIFGVDLLVRILEDKDEWSHSQSVDDEKSDAKVPDGTECAMTVHEVPRQLGSALHDLIFEVLVFGLLIDDITSVQLLHLLFLSGILSQFAVMGSSERPQVLDTLWCWSLFWLILMLSLSVSLLFRPGSQANTNATAEDFCLLIVVTLPSLFVFDDLGLNLFGIQIVVVSIVSTFF